MKRLTIILFSLFVLQTSAQVVVKGLVTEQNSGGKMLPGVEIKSLGGIPEVSDNAGLFQLTFAGKKPGDRIYVEVNKSGYEVVNRKEILEDWLIGKDPKERTKVVMCPEGMVAQNMAKYYRISEKALTKGYYEKIDALMTERGQAKIDAKRYAEQAKLLEEQFKNQRKQLDELAEKFARENFDDYTGIQKQAADSFMAGNIEAAISILGTINSEEEMKKALRQKEKGEKLIAEGKQMQEEADSIIQQNIRKLMFQGDLYKATFRLDEAEKAYDVAVNADTTNLQNSFQYANFLSSMFKVTKAKAIYERLVRLSDNAVTLALATQNLALVLQINKEYHKSEIAYCQSLDVSRKLAINNQPDKLINLSIVLTAFAGLKNEMMQYDKADSYYNEAIGVLKRVKDEDEKKTTQMRYILNLYGYFLHSNNRLKEAETIYREALDISDTPVDKSFTLKVLANLLKIEYKFDEALEYGEQAVDLLKNSCSIDLATSYITLADIQSTMKRYDEALKNIEAGMDCFASQINVNPLPVKYMIASALNLKGSIQYNLRHARESMQAYSQALSIFEEINTWNPDLYQSQIASANVNLGMCYRDLIFNTDSTNSYFSRALKVYENMESVSHKVIYPQMVTVLNNLGTNETNRRNYGLAANYFERSVKLTRILADDNPKLYTQMLAFTLNQFGLSAQYNQDFNKAVTLQKEALAYYRSLAKDSPNIYFPQVGIVLNSLGSVYCLTHRYPESQSAFSESTAIFRKLAQRDSLMYAPLLASTLQMTAELYFSKGEMDLAQNLYVEVLDLYKSPVVRPQSIDGEAAVYIRMGDVQKALKNTDESGKYFYRSAKAYKDLIPINAMYNMWLEKCLAELDTIGRYYMDRGDSALQQSLFDDAKTWYQKADTTFNEKNELKPDLNNNWMIGWVYYHLSNCTSNKRTKIIYLRNALDKRLEVYQMYQNENTTPVIIQNYGNLSWFYLFGKQFAQSGSMARKAISLAVDNQINESQYIWIYTNLAHSLLFQGKYDEAKKIYLELKDQMYPNDPDKKTFNYFFLQDFDEFEKAGITHPDIARIREFLQ